MNIARAFGRCTDQQTVDKGDDVSVVLLVEDVAMDSPLSRGCYLFECVSHAPGHYRGVASRGRHRVGSKCAFHLGVEISPS